MPIRSDHIKRRVIRFEPGDNDQTAVRAAQLLDAVEGVNRTGVFGPHALLIYYDIRQLSLQMIERALADVGFTLKDNLFCRIKRELIAYSEDNQREAFMLEQQEQEREHEHVDSTAHDPRPWHWRNYS